MRKEIKKKIRKIQETGNKMEDLFSLIFSDEQAIMAEYTETGKQISVTYGESKEHISRLAGQLSYRLKDIPKGKVVGLSMKNCLEFIEVFWAILMSGHVPLFLNQRLSQEIQNKALHDIEACAVITDEEKFPIPTIPFRDLYHGGKHSEKEGFADKIAFMSSGTSGEAKICIYDGKALRRQLDNTEFVIRQNKEIASSVKGRMKILLLLPLYHVFGFLASYLWFAALGETFVFPGESRREDLLSVIRKFGVTHLFSVPLLFVSIEQKAKMLLEQKKITEKKIARLAWLPGKMGSFIRKKMFAPLRQRLLGEDIRFMITGGGDIPGHTLSFFNSIGYRLVNGFGMTEAGITSVNLSGTPKVISKGTVGFPLPSVMYKLKNGELLIKGDTVAGEILQNGKQKISQDGWLHTGDLAMYTEAGWKITGRKDDLVTSRSGENICPFTLEEKISVPGCSVALLSLPGKDGGRQSFLLISVAERENETKIRKEVIRQLSGGGLYRFVDSIGVTFSPLLEENEIKLNRKRLTEGVASGKIPLSENGSNPSDTGAPCALERKIGELFSKVLGYSVLPIQYSRNFFYELGGNSLGYFQLTEEIKEEFHVDILSVPGQALYSVKDMYRYIEKNKPKSEQGEKTSPLQERSENNGQ